MKGRGFIASGEWRNCVSQPVRNGGDLWGYTAAECTNYFVNSGYAAT
jgi:hypothetical protein